MIPSLDESRFISIYHALIKRAWIEILVDKETNVQYLTRIGPSTMTMTPLLDQSGKPLLYEPPDETDT